MTNYPFTALEEFRDLESRNWYAEQTALGRDPAEVLDELCAMGRDNARTPMQWDASPQAGFTTGEPWLPVNPNHAAVNAEAARADPDSVFHHYRRLHALRHTVPALVHGDFTLLLPEHDHLYAYTRRHDRVELLVLANLSGEPVSAEGLPDAAVWARAELLLGNVPAADPARLTLEPWEARLYRSTGPGGGLGHDGVA